MEQNKELALDTEKNQENETNLIQEGINNKVTELMTGMLQDICLKDQEAQNAKRFEEKEKQRKLFMEAMASASVEIPKITTNKEVYDKDSKPIYKYPDLATIVNNVKPVLAKHGLFVEFRSIPDFANSTMSTMLIVHHKDGYSYKSEIFTVRVRDMNDIQNLGSAVTYSKRYMFCSMFNICAESDDDGNKASGREQNQVKEIEKEKKQKEQAKQEKALPPKPQKPEEPQSGTSRQKYTCADCGKEISETEYSTFARQNRPAYCFKCQENH